MTRKLWGSRAEVTVEVTDPNDLIAIDKPSLLGAVDDLLLDSLAWLAMFCAESFRFP